MLTIVLILALIGLIISIYGIIEERKMQQDALYKPACDISDMISCSRAFLSPYGKIFGISNIWASALYYIMMIILAALDFTTLALITASAGVAVSIVFAYILYFKIKTVCPICTSLYVVNIALLVACYFS